MALAFLTPALVFLCGILLYPVLYTVIRSFYSPSGAQFVGLANYVHMFTSESTFTAIRNNIIWVVVAPFSCTALGLVFAVLMEKIRWATAFKLIVFMPMAISMLAAGVIFRGMFQADPQHGVVNAAMVAVSDLFSDQASLPGAGPREDVGISAVTDSGAISTDQSVQPGTVQSFPLTGIRAEDVPTDAEQAEPPAAPSADEITGTVWLDVVRGGGGTNGHIDPGKPGLPGVRVQAADADGQVVAEATTDDTGKFTLSGLDPGAYTVVLPAGNFDTGFGGINWLGPSFITAVVIGSFVWIWAGSRW